MVAVCVAGLMLLQALLVLVPSSASGAATAICAASGAGMDSAPADAPRGCAPGLACCEVARAIPLSGPFLGVIERPPQMERAPRRRPDSAPSARIRHDWSSRAPPLG